MKKILLSILLLSFGFAVMAQDAKPTKDQTIEYLVNFLNHYESDKKVTLPGQVEAHYIHKLNSFSIKDCQVSLQAFYYHTSNMSDKITQRTTEFSFNLTDVEKVDLSSTKLGDHIFYFIKITAHNKKKNFSSKEVGQTETYTDSISFSIPNDEKIIQAFNHLRKLCGAPEPIKF